MPIPHLVGKCGIKLLVFSVLLADYSGGQISRMVENVVLINIVLYGTMPLKYEKNTCEKSKERSHTLEPWATNPTLNLHLKVTF